MVNVVLATHGKLAVSLLETAQSMVGEQETVYIVAVEGHTLNSVLTDFSALLQSMDLNAGLIVLTDIYGGTPANAALMAFKHLDNCRIISGLSLPMLLSALLNRKELELAALAAKIVADAKKGVVDAGDILKNKEKNV